MFKMYSNVKVDKTCVLYLSESESLEKLANSSWTAETFVHIAYIEMSQGGKNNAFFFRKKTVFPQKICVCVPLLSTVVLTDRQYS